MNNVMVFDIETIPDIEGARRLQNFDGLDDREVAKALFHQRMQAAGTEFLRHHMHRIVAISVVFRHGDSVRVWTLGDEQSSEAELLQRFFDGIDRYTPNLVSWNGGGFDLPVIHYRSLINKVAAARYWERGQDDQSFRYDNYISRYHWRHLDLMDVLAMYQPRANVPLDEMASLLGFPGKMGMDGSKVWDAYCDGELKSIRDYCETDVLNTYLVYLRFELMRGGLTAEQFDDECAKLHQVLSDSSETHLQAFLQQWQTKSP